MKIIIHKFLDTLPYLNDMEEDTLYISVKYATAAHRCFCGCGNEVITPLESAKWKLIQTRNTISLDPSIGNWDLDCKSHYWIKKNKIIWARKFTQKEIQLNKELDMNAIKRYYSYKNKSQLTKMSRLLIFIKNFFTKL